MHAAYFRTPARALGALLLALGVLLGVLVAAPAQAASDSATVVCKGFVPCNLSLHGNYGYDLVYQQKFWNMSGGHNCTNYVAYRLTSNGRMTAKPGGSGNAATWGPAAKAAGIPVTTSPKRGDVAWWPSKYHNAGVRGHVAMVEYVYADGSVLLSQDNWDNDFGYMKAGPKSSVFPKGFIRYPQSDGTPVGKVSAVKVLDPTDGSGMRRVEFSGSLSDPDAPRTADGRDATVRFDWSDGRSSETKVQPSFRWQFSKPNGIYTVNVIAKNVGRGKDVLLGTYHVNVSTGAVSGVSSSSKARAVVKMSASSVVSRKKHPVVSVAVRAVGSDAKPTGTVRVYDGKKKVATKRVYSNGKVKVRLPKLKKGTHKISVKYVGNADLRAASAAKKVHSR